MNLSCLSGEAIRFSLVKLHREKRERNNDDSSGAYKLSLQRTRLHRPSSSLSSRFESVKPAHFAQVQINESLTFNFADESDPDGEPDFNTTAIQSHHYAFHVSNGEFDAIF